MSVLDISSIDEGEKLEELDFAGVTPLDEGPTYGELLEHEAELARSFPDPDLVDRSAFEEGLEVGRQMLARELIDGAPGGFKSQADAARWARWAAHRLNTVIACPKI